MIQMWRTREVVNIWRNKNRMLVELASWLVQKLIETNNLDNVIH
jgi:hypothetical protein